MTDNQTTNDPAEASDPPVTAKADLPQDVVRRLGRFSVSTQLLHSNWKEVLLATREMVVVRAESRWDKDCIDYVALSDRFDAVAVGVEPPEYQAIFTRHANGEIAARWERVKDWRRDSANTQVERSTGAGIDSDSTQDVTAPKDSL